MVRDVGWAGAALVVAAGVAVAGVAAEVVATGVAGTGGPALARACAWTHVCDESGLSIHANDTGHAVLAGAFERSVDGYFRGDGTWLADAGGGVFAFGHAAFDGSERAGTDPVVAVAAEG